MEKLRRDILKNNPRVKDELNLIPDEKLLLLINTTLKETVCRIIHAYYFEKVHVDIIVEKTGYSRAYVYKLKRSGISWINYRIRQAGLVGFKLERILERYIEHKKNKDKNWQQIYDLVSEAIALCKL